MHYLVHPKPNQINLVRSSWNSPRKKTFTGVTFIFYDDYYLINAATATAAAALCCCRVTTASGTAKDIIVAKHALLISAMFSLSTYLGNDDVIERGVRGFKHVSINM